MNGLRFGFVACNFVLPTYQQPLHIFSSIDGLLALDK